MPGPAKFPSFKIWPNWICNWKGCNDLKWVKRVLCKAPLRCFFLHGCLIWLSDWVHLPLIILLCFVCVLLSCPFICHCLLACFLYVLCVYLNSPQSAPTVFVAWPICSLMLNAQLSPDESLTPREVGNYYYYKPQRISFLWGLSHADWLYSLSC